MPFAMFNMTPNIFHLLGTDVRYSFFTRSPTEKILCIIILYIHVHRTDHPASLSWLAVRCPHVLISSSPQHEVGSSNSLWECRGDKSSSQPTAHRDRHTGSPLLLASPPSSRLISIPLPLSAPEGKQCNTLRDGHIEKAESALVSSHEALLYHCGSLQARPVASSFKLVTTRSECGNYNYTSMKNIFQKCIGM